MEAGIRSTNRLTDRGVRAWIAARAAGKEGTPTKLFDGGGLHLVRTPAGTPAWRLKYRFGGTERVFALGRYPAVTLEKARRERERIRAELQAGADPMAARRARRGSGAASTDESARRTFREVSEEWLALRRTDWSAVHHATSRRALERDVWPALGDRRIDAISSAMLAVPIEAIVARGSVDTASKVLFHMVCVFKFALARGYCAANPAEAVREVLPRRRVKGRRRALTDADALRELLRRADASPLSPAVRLASRLCAWSASRIGPVVQAEWREFALDVPAGELATWTIPRAKLKVRDRPFDLKILLGPTIAAELRAWRDTTGGAGFVFGSPTGADFLSRESVEKAYRVTLGLGGKHTPHGWRASFSTLARDADFSAEVVALALDHLHSSQVQRAYDRGERLAERQRLARWWDALLSGRAP